MYNLFPMLELLEEDKKPLWLSLSKPMPIHKADLVVFVQRLNSLALYPGVSWNSVIKKVQALGFVMER